jgi:hypothetical protein
VWAPRWEGSERAGAFEDLDRGFLDPVGVAILEEARE